MTNTDFTNVHAKLHALAELALSIERLDEYGELTLASSPDNADLAIAAAAFQRAVLRQLPTAET